MTTEQLAEYLGIQSSNISIQDNVFQVSQSIITKIDIAFWQQEFSVHFSECIFECNYVCVSSDRIQKVAINIEMNFSECDFKQVVGFQRCIFEKNIAFFDCLAQEVNISECVFRKDFSFTQSDKHPQKQKPRIDKVLMLGPCTFQNISLNGLALKNDFCCGAIEVFGKANFQFMTCEKKVTFEIGVVKNENNEIVKKGDRSVFKKLVSFEGSKFNDNILLGQCIFEGIINFSRCEFEKDISFCNSIFRNPLILYRSKIDKKMFLINSKWEFDFEKCLQSSKEQFFIGYQYSPRSQNQNTGIYRDSFNTIKHTLVNNNNYLDASKHFCYKLYCKEIELDSKPQKSWRDKIDSLQLWFYRLTSDHHTDLAKIFNNVIMLIALFGIFAFGLLDFSAYPQPTDSKTSFNFIFGKISLLPKSLAWIILGICFGIWGLSKLPKCRLFKVLKIKLPKKFSKIRLSEWVCYGFLALCCGAFAFGVFAPLLSSIITLYKLSIPSLKEVFLIFGICLSFVIGYLGLIRYSDQGLILIAYLICGGILIFKPSLLLPFVGQLFDEGLKANFPAMQSLSVVYCILMFLMLFSLQKTARKNSIIPS